MKHADISLNTKKLLSTALKEAMQKKPFSKITVSELIRECNLNRKTFYYHFDDIYSLLKWTFEQEAIEVIKHFDLLVDYEDAITFVIDYVDANDYILNCACNSIGLVELKKFFYTDFYDIVVSMITDAEKLLGKTLDKKYKIFLSNFYVEAIAGTLVDLIQNKKARNRNLIIKYFSDTIRESLTEVITHVQKS